MPTPSPTLTNSERTATADRLWRAIAMCDAGRPISDIREAIRFTAHALEHEGWMPDSKDRPTNLETAA